MKATAFLASTFTSLLLVASASAQTFTQPEAQVLPPDQNGVESSVKADTTFQGSSFGDYDLFTHDVTHQPVGFKFENRGGNKTVPVPERDIGMGPDRLFRMEFRNRARQDMQLHITDIPNEYFSEFMESYFYFFPRNNLPAIQSSSREAKTFTMILPTGEPVVFDSATKEIVGGVLTETRPIDLGPNRFTRKFAGIQYTGTGLYMRVDKRGNDPRLGTVATAYQGNKTCKLSSALLFNQDKRSHVEFLFPTDAEFNELLKTKCKMSFL